MSLLNFGTKKEPKMEPPRVNLAQQPRNLDAAPYDHELETALSSAAAIRTMRETITALTIDRDHFRQQAEIWKARAEAEASLLQDIKRERDKLSDFKTEMVRQFKNCETMIREMMNKATDFALRPQDPPKAQLGTGDDGQPVPTFLTDRDLTPPQTEKPHAE